MILSKPVSRGNIPAPTLGQACASVLFLRGLIAEKDEGLIAEVVTRFMGDAEPIACELTRRCLISGQNEAAVTEYIRRAVRRFLLKTNGRLADEDLARLLGVEVSVARRIKKGTHNLDSEQIKKLAAHASTLVAPAPQPILKSA